MKQHSVDTTSLLFLIAVFVSIFLTLGIWFLDPLLNRFSHIPDQGPSWYYWKLTPQQFQGKITALTGYILHQLFAWLCVAAFKKRRASGAAAFHALILLR